MTGDNYDDTDGAVLEPLAKTDWAETPSDPSGHLGYDLRDWEVLTTSRKSDQVVFLPEDEELLRENAFIVVERDTLRALEDNR